jgi:hypothetical protein
MAKKKKKPIPDEIVENEDGVFYYKNGLYHREDGPACLWTFDGQESWYRNGVRHRVEGPALYSDSDPETEAWFFSGKYHNETGPAIVYSKKAMKMMEQEDIPPAWYIHGVDITNEVNQWLQENDITLPLNDEQKILFKLRFV